jgi:hypothetical protein
MADARSKSKSWWYLWVAVAAAGVVAVLCVTVFLLWYVFHLAGFVIDVKRGEPTALAFLTDVSNGDATHAYARTSQSFQRRLSYEEFVKLLGRDQILGQQWVGQITGCSTSLLPSGKGLLSRPFGSRGVILCVRLVSEEGAWRVDDFRAPHVDGGLLNAIESLRDGDRSQVP